jgi:hypothetical protein
MSKPKTSGDEKLKKRRSSLGNSRKKSSDGGVGLFQTSNMTDERKLSIGGNSGKP